MRSLAISSVTGARRDDIPTPTPCCHPSRGGAAVELVVAVLLLTVVIITTPSFPGIVVYPQVADALAFNVRCQTDRLYTFADAQALCEVSGEFLASPRTSVEFTLMDNVTVADGRTQLVLNAGSLLKNTWRWLYGPFAEEAVYMASSGGRSLVDNADPWATGSVPGNSAAGGSNKQIAITHATGWLPVTSIPMSTRCAVCQSLYCSEICSPTGTASYTALSLTWNTCACTCKPGYKGAQCQNQITTHCDETRTSSIILSEGVSLCAAKGGFLATPNTAQALLDIQRQYPTYADDQTYFESVLIAGSDEVTSEKWLWKDGPLAGVQLWQGLAAGTPRNGFPSSNWKSGEPNHVGTERQIAIKTVGLADCDASSSCGYKCYACQYTGCDAAGSHPCNTTNTLSMSGTDYSDCKCKCKAGFGGRFCECPIGSCSPRGGFMTSSITMAEGTVCTCSCKATYRGVNCDEHTNTSTMTYSHIPTTSGTITQTVELSAESDTPTTSISTPETASHSITATVIIKLLSSLPQQLASCPTTTITIAIVRNGTRTPVPTGGLTDAMIRSGGVVVNITLSSAVDTSIEFASPTIFTFGVESLGVSDPRSYPSVVNLADIQCGFYPTTHRTVLCELPASPDYVIRDAESLRITATSSSMINSGPCGSTSEVLIGTVVVSPAAADALTASLQAAFTVVTTVTTVVISILGDGSPIETQVLVMILDSPCAATYDRKSVAWVRYIVMPGAALGPSWTMGINVMIAVGVVVIHCIAVLITFRLKGATATSQQVRTLLMFPGISVSVAQVMYAGVMYGTMNILRTESGGAGAAAIVGLLYMVLVPAVVVYLLAYHANVLYYPYNWDVEGVSKGRRWLYPHGFWSPKSKMFRLFGVIGPYRIGMHYAALSPFLLALTIAIFMAALPGTILCDYLYVAVGVAGIVLGLAVLVGNPMRSRLQSIITAFCLALLGLLAILQIVAIRSNSETIVIAKGVCNYVLITLLALRAFHSIFIFVFEFKSKDELIANMRERGDTIVTEEDSNARSGLFGPPATITYDTEMTSECTTACTTGTTPHTISSPHGLSQNRRGSIDVVGGGGGGTISANVPYLMSAPDSHSFTSSSMANTSPKSETIDFQPPIENDLLVSSCNFVANSNSFNTPNIGLSRGGGRGGCKGGGGGRGNSSSKRDSGDGHNNNNRSTLSDIVPVAGPLGGTPSMRSGSVVSASSLGASFNHRSSSIAHQLPTTPLFVYGSVPFDACDHRNDNSSNAEIQSSQGTLADHMTGGGSSHRSGSDAAVSLLVGRPLGSFVNQYLQLRPGFDTSDEMTEGSTSYHHHQVVGIGSGGARVVTTTTTPRIRPSTTPSTSLIIMVPPPSTLAHNDAGDDGDNEDRTSLRRASSTEVSSTIIIGASSMTGGAYRTISPIQGDVGGPSNINDNHSHILATSPSTYTSIAAPEERVVGDTGGGRMQVFGHDDMGASVASSQYVDDNLVATPFQLAFDFN